jgi:hypothetical protein
MKRALLLLMVVGCAEARLVAEEPVWGKQQCAHCAMLVSEKPPAAQAVTADSRRRFFDDVGCLVAWEQREQPTVAARWVRTPEGKWVDPASTRFSSGQATPMDFGFLPSAEGSATFDDVRAAVQQKSARGSAP